MQALGVVPADPRDDGTFYLVSSPPGSLVLDQLSLERAVGGLGRGIDAPIVRQIAFIAVRDGVDGRGRASLRQPIAVAD